jgi:DNA-binding LacI/PurR family transcriptional regulator
MSKKHISLKDIARELGISISTVSRALKNHPDVSKEVIVSVQELARKWRYTPNPLAMGLLKQKSGTIGVVVPELVSYFFSSVISGIESYAEEKGFSIVISSSNESYKKEVECVGNLLNLRVEGIIVCLAQDTNDYLHFDSVLENEVPLVFFDRICRTNEFSSVVADNIEAARAITMHLCNSGAKRVAFIAGPEHLNITRDRMAGYFKGLKACSKEIDQNLVLHTNISPEAATEATRYLLKMQNPPDALFTINDNMAFTVMKELKKAGKRIPEDISVIGFTDEFHATVVEPNLTSVTHPTLEMGLEAARLLIAQIESNEKMVPRQVVMQTKLIIRESSVKQK